MWIVNRRKKCKYRVLVLALFSLPCGILGESLSVSSSFVPSVRLQIAQCAHWPLGFSGSPDIHVWGFFPKCPDTQSPLVLLHLQKSFLGYSPDPGTFSACWWKRFLNCGNLQRLHILQMRVQTPNDSKCGVKWTEVIPLVWHVWDNITTTPCSHVCHGKRRSNKSLVPWPTWALTVYCLTPNAFSVLVYIF